MTKAEWDKMQQQMREFEALADKAIERARQRLMLPPDADVPSTEWRKDLEAIVAEGN